MGAPGSDTEDAPGAGGAAVTGESEGPNPSDSSKVYSYKAWAEEEALQEAQMAVTEIVIPLQQPVELLPRADSVLQAQIKLLNRYKLGHEVVGEGADARLRILPRAMAPSVQAA